MADVYVGIQISLGRQVAVKVLRAETVRSVGGVARFEREARAAAALVHGNIVQIHEVACVDGIHFLAEEFVAGPTLRTWLDVRGPLDPAQALSVLEQVASALQRAAEYGVVHRDIKPENLLVTPAGEVKVADFGLAQVAVDDAGLTQDGTTLGTPLYMSPEQARGQDVDVRSDLYSLGATVYHLLAGRAPFGGASLVSIVLAHVNDPLPPLGDVRPGLPSRLVDLVERLLAKDRDHRLDSPVALLRAVAEIRVAEPATAAGHGPLPLAWKGTVEQWGVSTFSDRSGSAGGGGSFGVVMPDAPGGGLTGRRRVVAAVAVAGLAGLAGFAASRVRARRSNLFRLPR